MLFKFSLDWNYHLIEFVLKRLVAELRWPVGPPAEHHNYKNRTTCMHRNRNPCNSLFMVNMASGMDHWNVRTTTTTSRNMAAIQLIPSHVVLNYSIYVWYWASILCLLESCHIKRSVDQYHVTISRAQTELIKVVCCFQVDRWPSTGFRLDRGLMSG